MRCLAPATEVVASAALLREVQPGSRVGAKSTFGMRLCFVLFSLYCFRGLRSLVNLTTAVPYTRGVSVSTVWEMYRNG